MARNIANLVVTVQANTTQASGSLNVLALQVNDFGKSFAGASKGAVAWGVVMGNVLTKVAELAFAAGKALISMGVGIFKDAVAASGKLNAAMLGLTSTAGAFGITTDKATEAARKLSSDGLLPLSDSAKSLQNLIAMGFDLAKAADIVDAFKNSAIFLRQETYTVGAAVRTATEGLRSFRSQASDNAGMTTNLSVILGQYGFKLQDVSDKTKGAAALAALHAGIMRETRAQMGLAAQALGTYTGAMASFATAQENLLAAMGNAITRNAAFVMGVNYLAEAMRHLEGWFHNNQQAIADWVTNGLVFAVKMLAGLIDALAWTHRAVNQLDIAFRQMAYGFAWSVNEIVASWPNEFFNRFNKMGQTLLMGLNPQLRELIVTFGEMQVKTTKSMAAMKAGIDADKAAITQWDTALGGTSTSLRKLADDMWNTKGTMLSVDLAGQKVGDRFAGLPDKIDKATAKFKKWWDTMDRHAKTGLSSMPGLEYPFGKDGIKLLPTVMQFDIELQKLIDRIPVKLGMTAAPGLKMPLPTMPHYDMVMDTFRVLGDELSNIIAAAFKSNSVMDAAVGMAAAVGGIFSQGFARALKQRQIEQGTQTPTMSGGEMALGYTGTAMSSFVQGYQIGQSGGRVKGVVGGAMSGAMAGAPLGYYGMAVGAFAGGMGGLVGGEGSHRDQMRKVRENLQNLQAEYGGSRKLSQAMELLGVDIEQAFEAKNAKEFDRVMGELNRKLAEQKQRMEALGVDNRYYNKSAFEGLEKRLSIFASPFEVMTKAIDEAKTALASESLAADDAAKAHATIAANTAKMAEAAQRSQPEFERLGLMVRGVFAGLVKETGSAIGAMNQMIPQFTTLQNAVEKWGFSNSAVTEGLLANFQMISDEVMGPFAQAIDASGAILKGLIDARAMNPELFQALATDIGVSMQGLIDKGAEQARVLALSAPVLQTLWENQQLYGTITDETTLALLGQAEAQGLVGEHMKSTNQKILDVLLAIGKVLGADIPDGLRGLVPAAEDAAAGINDAFAGIEDPTVTVHTVWEGPGGTNTDIGVPALARGGIVRRPTLAMIGERGPEAVIPLSGSALGASSTYITDVYLDGERIARSTAKKMPRVLRGMGV